MPARRRLDVYGFKQTYAHHLSNAASVVPISFVYTSGKHRMHVPGLDTDRWPAGIHQPRVDPFRQSPSFQSDTFDWLMLQLQLF